MATAKRLFSPPKGRFLRDKDTERFSDASGRYQGNAGGRSRYHPSPGGGGGKGAGYVATSPVKSAQGAAAKPAAIRKPREGHFYPEEIFANRAEYAASVDSVVARIKSGEVQARTPDE